MQQPAAELRIDADLVRRLVNEQHPSLSANQVTRIGEGWDNVTYRLGAAHAVRLPRRAAAVPLLRNEQRWLPEIAARLPIRVPSPVALGKPSATFPWPWSVVEWIEGTPALDARPSAGIGPDTPLAHDTTAARDLARILRALHRPAPTGAPKNPLRGVPLAARRVDVEARLAVRDDPALSRLWAEALSQPPATKARWLHGDLHPENILVVHGSGLVGLIDWGDLCGGDVATDLAVAWMLFDASGRAAFWDAYAPNPAARKRAAGWAIHFGTIFAAATERRYARLGEVTLARLTA